MFKYWGYCLFAIAITAISPAFAQTNYQVIPLPAAISGVNEEFSGMTQWNGRVYFEPQYGDHKETMTDGEFNIYSISADSIRRVINGDDKALTAYRTLKVLNLDKLPDSIKKVYQGFEAITIVNGKVYLSIETTETYAYCFLLKGTIDTFKNEIHVDPVKFMALKRPLYIKNAGFESVTYLPKEHKLLALYEFNASAKGNTGLLIDTPFSTPPVVVKAPFLYFRITDLTTAADGRLYGMNYYYNGDYKDYLDNGILHNPEADIKKAIPQLSDSLDKNPGYLKQRTYARIITRKNYKDMNWQHVTSFDGYRNNWEGLTLFDKGALIVTDANRSGKQVTVLAYVKF